MNGDPTWLAPDEPERPNPIPPAPIPVPTPPPLRPFPTPKWEPPAGSRGEKVWLPVSQLEFYPDGKISVPQWLADEKEIEGRERR